ncbi:acyl carrier protein [Saccharopolyspora indica]|uniref:acyl carrier protein n=1 Tax=Saccharopolyspora indica TaxID=1229659 RepID=UPI0022EB3966|nr:acyl carrier protein [Saccharopolyspora indica]MDA3645738.1 acyl carrier protein [Saccharopolyspora indica]
MAEKLFTIDDLRRILREAAGVDENVDINGDIHDLEFEELGYESLALLETATRIEREFGVELEDSVITEARTPAALLAVVNGALRSSAA